jgi:hypothetical protein
MSLSLSLSLSLPDRLGVTQQIDPPAVETRYPAHNIVHIPTFDPAHADALIQARTRNSEPETRKLKLET